MPDSALDHLSRQMRTARDYAAENMEACVDEYFAMVRQGGENPGPHFIELARICGSIVKGSQPENFFLARTILQDVAKQAGHWPDQLH